MPENSEQRTSAAGRIAARVGGHDFDLEAAAVERTAAALTPEPIQEHYVVVGGRRFPPKQLFSAVTGLDRADFTTHQARRVWRRLGFGVHRRSTPNPSLVATDHSRGPRGGAEAALLAPFAGKWIAQRGDEVLVAEDDPRRVVEWLRKHDQRADAVFRVPTSEAELGGAMTQAR
ncbi:MAG: hypothetical protein SGJ13_00830 [Actinomycetota bacterium]|nr:hypothetical protein [Actinomycetota bacterium]